MVHVDLGFRSASTLTLRTGLQALGYALWDSDLERLVAVSLRRRRLGDMCGINQQSGDSRMALRGATLLDWKKSKGAEGYVPPRSNGLIAGRSLMIAHNLESVSGSRLLWPAMVIK